MDDRADHRRSSARPFELLDRRGGAEPGIVEQHVEPAERRLGLGEQRLDRGRVADIGRHAERLALHRLDLADDRVQAAPGRRPATTTRKPLARQRQRRCLADAAAAAGDESDLAVRSHVLSFLGCRIADLARTISGTAPGIRRICGGALPPSRAHDIVSSGEHQMRLEALFRPRSIAVIGASEKPTIGRRHDRLARPDRLRRPRSTRSTRTYPSVLGRPCYPSHRRRCRRRRMSRCSVSAIARVLDAFVAAARARHQRRGDL